MSKTGPFLYNRNTTPRSTHDLSAWVAAYNLPNCKFRASMARTTGNPLPVLTFSSVPSEGADGSITLTMVQQQGGTQGALIQLVAAAAAGARIPVGDYLMDIILEDPFGNLIPIYDAPFQVTVSDGVTAITT